MNSLAEQLVLNIIKQELPLVNQRGWVRFQNIPIPDDDGIYVIVGMVDSQVMSNVDTVTPISDETAGMQELQQVQMRENIQIDVFSRDNSALSRHWEILAALRSIYSVQVQEENYFKIFAVPTSFVNTSAAEGGSNLNRFTLVVSCFVWYNKEKMLQSPKGYNYFDNFETRVDDEQSIDQDHGIIEFDITN